MSAPTQPQAPAIVRPGSFCLFSRHFSEKVGGKVISLNAHLCAFSAPKKIHHLQVFFSGVLYNLTQLVAQHTLAAPDPETAIAVLYKKLGPEIATHLDGAYAIVILDGPDLTLLRDREGLESLYYTKKNDAVIISNSMQEIKKLVKLEVNSRDLPKYFVLDQINDEHTFFKDVYQVKILEILKVHCADNTWQSRTYDPIAYAPMRGERLDDDQIVTRLEELLADRIRTLIAAFPHSPVLNTQSGGTDSALTQCLLKNLGSNQSICANFSTYGLDAQYSQEVAHHLGSDHTIVEVGVAQFLENLQEGIKVFGMPLMFEGESMFNFMYKQLGRQTSPHGPPVICFDSNGADAILGHGRLLMALNVIEKSPGFFGFLTRVARHVARNPVVGMMHEIAKGARTGDMTPQLYFAIFNLNARVELVRKAFGLTDVTFIPEFELAEQAKYPVSLLERMYRLQVFQYEVKRINNITFQLARRCNVIMLYPFRDKSLTEFFLNIPTGRKVKHRVQKYYGKKLLTKYLPAELVYRQKINKGIPYQKIFKEEAGFAALISEIREARYRYFDFDLDAVFGTPGLEGFAMKVINFHIWHELFIA